jgi:hypothetical protein
VEGGRTVLLFLTLDLLLGCLFIEKTCFGLRIERANHKEELDNLSNILIKFKEKFCNEIENQSVKEVAS